MACRLAAAAGALLLSAALSSCGEAVGDPQPAGADEQQVLKDAAAMLPDADAPSRAGDAPGDESARPEI